MFRYIPFIIVALSLSSCGPSQDARDAQEAQENAHLQQIIAVNNTIAGKYTGTITDDSVTPPTVQKVYLEAVSTEVFSPVAGSSKMEEVPTIVGYLKEQAYDMQDGGPVSAPPLGAVNDKNQYWKCDTVTPPPPSPSPNSKSKTRKSKPKPKPSAPKQVCYHYTHNDERELATYGTGVFDPSTYSLQFWAASPTGQSSTNPVIGSAGLILTVSGTHAEGLYLPPLGGHEEISLDLDPTK